MLRVSATQSLPLELRGLLTTLPAYVDRRTGAELVTKHLFPVSHRSLEAWPLVTRRVNGKAIVATAELLAAAYAKLKAAPPTLSGRKNRTISADRPIAE